MKVILVERVPTLGNVGEIVNVSQGYGRNYLIPNKKAVLADDGHKAELENSRKRLQKKMDGEKKEALGLKKKVEGLKLELVKKVGASGRLFGTVTTSELSKHLGEKGIVIERRTLIVSEPIKKVGNFTVTAKLFTDVEASFQVKVVMDPKQVEELKAKQEKAAKKALEKKEKKDDKEEASEESVKTLTEEEKLKAEADKILRS
jgi:large subunit ribosomal protein L9